MSPSRLSPLIFRPMFKSLQRPAGLLIFLLVILPSPVTAGDLRQLADEPLAILFAKDINEKRSAEYVEQMSKRMGVGSTITGMLDAQLKQMTFTEARDPVNGQLFYLVQGLIPSVERVSFESVVDEDEARTLIESRRKQLGETATLKEDSNGVYTLTRHSEHESELAPDQEVQEYNNEGAGYSSKLEIVERDGKRYQKQSWTYTQQFRYQDRFLFSNSAIDFSDVRLPAAQDIYDSLGDSNDFGVRIYADRVPPGLRTMGWSLLNATMGTQLQQQDSEGDESWQMRQAGGNWALSLLKSLMFDVDYGEGEGLLASGRRPIRARFNLRPRRNSQLIKQLDELGSGRSRFAPLLRDDAGLSFHFCLALPEDGQQAVTALARWIEVEAGTSGLSRSEKAGYRSMAQALDDLAGEGTFEIMARVVHSKASGSVILTGIQLREQSQQVAHMQAVVEHIARQAGDGEVETTQRHGRPLVHVKLSVGSDSPLRISDLWIAQREGCLWMAMGGENAHEMIRIAADRCRSGGRAVHTRLLTTKIDLAHWMTWPKKDPTGLAGIPEWLDTGEGSRLISLLSSFGQETELQPTPLLKKVMAQRGDKEAWLTLDSGKSGLTAELELGAPLADWFLARQIDAQDQYMKSQMQRQNEANEAVRRAAEKSSSASE